MKFCIVCILSVFINCNAFAQQFSKQINSPDKKISVNVSLGAEHTLRYTVSFAAQGKNEKILTDCKLGLIREDEDFVNNLSLLSASQPVLITDNYQTVNAKKSNITYKANKQVFHFKNKNDKKLDIIFQVSNDGVAFRYYFPDIDADKKTIVSEATTYTFAQTSTAFLQPMQVAKSGWANVNPAYEEPYRQNIPVGTYSIAGWVYPALFKTHNTWVLITEANMDGTYCGTKLYNDSLSATYHVAFADKREVMPQTGNGYLPASILPWYTPWRIITMGNLATIAESTMGTDLATPAPKTFNNSYIKPGKASWSWIMKKDSGTVYDEQIKYIDFAADMHWQYCLVDALWDTQIGYEKTKELSDYARKKNVDLLLWYNSGGDWNAVSITPKDKLLTHELRIQEFARLKAMGIVGVKIDFMGGDGQSVMKYYTDILADAVTYNLMVNFHGSTLPRGWSRTYPNLISQEAVYGFEQVTFGQSGADGEASHATILPFTRNAFDPMDFTPMNLYKVESSSSIRKTTSAFELALSVLFLSGIQHYAESPEGMSQQPEFIKNFLRQLPNNWDDCKFIDGYPGKLYVMARRAGTKWYVAGINGEAIEKILELNLAFLKNKKATLITDGTNPLSFIKETLTIAANSKLKMPIKANGGFVLVFE